ncbi:MAG: sugar ABC transporter permease [Caldilineaceae bacterium]|nr:sugar ABC transporter permease [Caldilineaceae bacterium]
MTRLQNRTLLLFLAPALLMITVFTLLPALWAVYVSFTDLALAGPKALNYGFVGLRNYVKLFSDRNFHNSLSLSLQYTLYTNLGQFVIGLTAALILNRRKLRGQTLLLAVIVLPMVIPGITQALIWSSMLGAGEFGTLNRILGLLGVDPVLWTRTAPMLSIVLINFWNNSGFAMILFLAGLESIPGEVIESATMDGANGWQMLTRIKLPLIRYVVLLWLLLNTIGCFGMFDLVFALTRGGPGNATELVGIYVYNQSFQFFELGYGSAAALVMLVISLLLALIYVRLMRVEF